MSLSGIPSARPAGFHLRALSRLPEAVQPMRASLRGYEIRSRLAKGRHAAVRPARRASSWPIAAATPSNGRATGRPWPTPCTRQAGGKQGYRYCDLLLGGAEPEDGSGLDGVAGIPVGQASPDDPAGRAEPADPIVRRCLTYKKACEEVRERGSYGLDLSLKFLGRGLGLLDVALDRLSLGRAHLGLALTSAAGFADAADPLDRAVDGLRQAGAEHHIPGGLPLAPPCAACASPTLPATPEPTSTPPPPTGDRDAARSCLARARELVTDCGYGRHEREVAWPEKALGDS